MHYPRFPFVLAILLVALSQVASAQALFDLRTDTARVRTFDLRHVFIDVRFEPARRLVIGHVEHRLSSLHELTQLELDADSAMRIERVTVDGRVARFELGERFLRIVLPSRAPAGRELHVAIDYTVSPRSGLYFILPDSNAPRLRPQIWTQGEAMQHHYWVPIYDYPNDRTTTEVRATVQGSWKVLSNGELLSRVDNSDGTSTWHYRLNAPHSTYLIALVAGDFLVTRDTIGIIPLEYWSYPEYPDRVDATFGATPDVIGYLERMLGVPYPWGRYAQVVVDGYMYGGMENTSTTVLNDNILIDPRWAIDYDPGEIIAHEAAHQWFGDLITNSSWRHLWIHESFVSYLAMRYLEHRSGEEAFAAEVEQSMYAAAELDRQIGADPIVGGSGHVGNLYGRGALVLRMLNTLIGEEAFWRGCRTLLERHAFGLVETEDVRRAFEEAAGISLREFFAQWIYGAGMPHLLVSQELRGDSVRVMIRQMQGRDSLTGLFTLPLRIDFHTSAGAITREVLMTTDSIAISVRLPGELRFVELDPGRRLLAAIEYDEANAQRLARLGSPNLLNRLDAAWDLEPRDSLEAHSVPLASGLTAAFFAEASPLVRAQLLRTLAKYRALEHVGAAVQHAFQDPSPMVRRAAAENALLLPENGLAMQLLNALLRDSSDLVVAEALQTMASLEGADIDSVLEAFRGRDSRRDVIARAWIDAVGAAGAVRFVDDIAELTTLDRGFPTRWRAYTALAALDTTTSRSRAAIVRGLQDRTGFIRRIAADAAASRPDAELRTLIAPIVSSLADDIREQMIELIGRE